MRASRRAAIGALLFVYVAVRLFWWYDGQNLTGDGRLLQALGAVKILAWVLPSIVVVALVHRLRLHGALGYLGLDKDIGRGLRFGLLATLPMAFAVAFAAPSRIDPVALAGTALIGPFAEEILFRGFLMKELVARARWPVGWAITVSAVAFGAAHVADLDLKLIGSIWQLTTPAADIAQGQLIGIATQIVLMGAGGAVFGWVFYRFRSLWPAFALHMCVNMWLTLSSGDQAAPRLDPVGVAQVASFGLALLLTLRRPVVTSPSPVQLS